MDKVPVTQLELKRLLRENKELKEKVADLEDDRKRFAKKGIHRIGVDDLPGFKVATWDIEATGLQATFGQMLCASVKPMGGETKVFRIDDYDGAHGEDTKLAMALRDELNKYHIVIGYNSLRYDLPFLNSRLIEYHEPIVSPLVRHIDVLIVARHRLRLHSNRLDALLDHLHSEHKKTPLTPHLWRRAAAGSKDALEEIVEHNICDVVALEEAFNTLLPFIEMNWRLIR
jgi:uncharacterized protein YprB with RNaseH-like and TPR domain